MKLLVKEEKNILGNLFCKSINNYLKNKEVWNEKWIDKCHEREYREDWLRNDRDERRYVLKTIIKHYFWSKIIEKIQSE